MRNMEKVISDYDVCMNSIYNGNCNLKDIDFSKFTENQQNEVVASAISMGITDAIVKLAQTPEFDLNRLPQIKELVDEKTYYNFSHGGISKREAKKIEKEINSAFERARNFVRTKGREMQ